MVGIVLKASSKPVLEPQDDLSRSLNFLEPWFSNPK